MLEILQADALTSKKREELGQKKLYAIPQPRGVSLACQSGSEAAREGWQEDPKKMEGKQDGENSQIYSRSTSAYLIGEVEVLPETATICLPLLTPNPLLPPSRLLSTQRGSSLIATAIPIPPLCHSLHEHW